MPDAGDFDRGADNARGAIDSWGDVFAALPQHAPDAGGWQRMQARLPMHATRPRARRMPWLATAAALLLAVAIPLKLLPRAEPAPSAPAPQIAVSASSPSAAVATPAATPPATASAAPPVSTPVAQRDPPRRVARTSPSQRPVRTVAPPAHATRFAAAEAAAASDLEPLYAQSAQLESLLAMARDDRVASGASAALSDELDGRVAAIDATLIQPGLTDAQRSELWGQRVDALQQLVGIETTNRLYAARGQRYDAALVSID